MNIRILTILTFLLVTSSLLSQEALPAFITDSLDGYVKSQKDKWKIPAIAIAIIKDGKVVKTITSGVTDHSSQTPINENTLFMIGSNSKAFTSTLVAMLAEEEKFNLKDPVKKWLPYFKLYDPYLTEKVNIIDILSHRVGFETFQGDFLNFDNELSSKEIIEKFSLIKPIHEYREKWGYFNTGYTIAGEIIESATGKTWEQQLRERIFIPLDMNNSLALSKEIQTAKNKTKAHTIVDDQVVEIDYGDIDATAPAGSISSSIADMSKWVITLLNNGSYKGTQVISSNAIKETRTPRTIMGSADYPFNLYGLGWDIESRGEHKFIMHTGGIHGYLTSVTLVPEENLGVVILTNTDSNYLYEGMKFDITNSLLGNPNYNVSDTYYTYYVKNETEKKINKEKWLADVELEKPPSISLDKFVGRYKNEVYGWAAIKREGNTLLLTFEHHKDLTVKLSHLENDVFLAQYNVALYGISKFPFIIEDEKIKYFTLKLDPSIERTTYDFYKE